MTGKVRRLPPAVRRLADDERGSITGALLVVIILTALSLILINSSLNLSVLSRAANAKSMSENTLDSLRTQVIGALNAKTLTAGQAGQACDNGRPLPGLTVPAGSCGKVTIDAPVPDNTNGTGNVMVNVHLEAWHPIHSGTGRLVDLRTSFQAYGTCVTGYVPGTGTDPGNPAVYTPCASAGQGELRYTIWVPRDSEPVTPGG
jgi:hypothetical protein